MADMLAAERKKRQQRVQEQGAVVTPPSANESTQAPGSQPQDKASSGS
jgi:hypothetical protein